MNVSLSEDQKKFIEDAIQGGRYFSSAEVVRAGLRLLMEREESRRAQLERLRNGIQLGLDDIENGNVVDAGEFFQALREQLLARKSAADE